MLSGKVAVVCGYGDVGKGCAEALAAHRCRVFVTEIDPLCALQAAMAGFRVSRLESVLPNADLVVTATGNRSIVTANHVKSLKNHAILANIGHFDSEIEVADFNAMSGVNKRSLQPGLDQYTTADGKIFYVLGEGRLVNLACSTGHPAFVMSCSFTNQALAQIALWQTQYATGVHRLPKTMDEDVARLHLDHLGVELTELTEAQASYLGVPRSGPYKPEHYRY